MHTEGIAGRKPPRAPERLAVVLEHKTFTSGADRDTVNNIYRNFFQQNARLATVLDFAAAWSLTSLQWGIEDICKLAEILQQFEGCEVLLLCRHNITDEGMDILAPKLRTLRRLKVLDFSSCGLSYMSANTIVGLFHDLPTLVRFTARGNDFSSGAASLQKEWDALKKPSDGLILAS